MYTTSNRIWSNLSSPAKLIIAGLAGVNLHASRNVSHVLDLQKGKLFLNANDTLYLGNAQHGSGNVFFNSSSYVIGKLSRWVVTGQSAYDFPVGNSNSDRRAQVVYTSPNANAAYLTCEFVNAQPGVLGLPLSQSGININKTGTEGYWRIRSASGFSSGLFSIYCLARQFGGVQNIGNLVLIRREQAGTPFQLIGNHIVGSGNIDSVVLGRTNVNNYGDFAVGGDVSQNPLPVELLSFQGWYEEQNNQVVLNWISSSEINVAAYQIESSLDGVNWNQEAEVKAKSYSISHTHYNWTGPFDAHAGLVYYRLKMLDVDASYEYSPILSIKKDVDGIMSLYPNPCTSNKVYLNAELEIRISDVSGKLVYEGTTSSIDVSSLDKGIYLVQSKYGVERLLLK